MSWSTLFGIANLAALIAWAMLILLPSRARLIPVLRFGGVGALCLLYAGLVVMALSGGFGRSDGPAPDFSTIPGVRAIFATDGGVVTGWLHYLALDLFAGVWIAEDADRRGFPRWGQASVLLVTFLAGPAGLLIWFAIRAVGQNQRGTAAL